MDAQLAKPWEEGRGRWVGEFLALLTQLCSSSMLLDCSAKEEKACSRAVVGQAQLCEPTLAGAVCMLPAANTKDETIES